MDDSYSPNYFDFIPRLQREKSILECKSHIGRTGRERVKNSRRISRRYDRDHSRYQTKKAK